MQHTGQCRRTSSSSSTSIGGKSTPISSLLLNLTITKAHTQRHHEHLPEPSPPPPPHMCNDHQCHKTTITHSDLGHQTEVSRRRTTKTSSCQQPRTTTTTTSSLFRSSTITRITLDRASDTDDDDEDETEDSRPITNHQEYHERLAVAEALARTSMMTSPAARRRLAARKVEMDLIAGGDDLDYDHIDYVPPKQLLVYMVR